MRWRLTPRDESFFELFAVQAGHLVDGATLLAELLGQDRAGRQVVVQRLRDAEHEADETTHEVMRRLTSALVTPFDRQDIYALASGLDECMDRMEAAGDLIVLYRLGELPPGVADQVAVLQRQAELTAAAMPRLGALKDLAEYWVEINRLENQADRTYRALLAELFDGSPDAVQLLKLREVVGALEAAVDSFEAVAHTVETIAVKEA